MSSPGTDRRPRLQGLRVGANPYAGLDLANARRVGALVWALAVFLEAVLFLLDPPSETWRWTGAAVLIAGAAAGAAALALGRWTPVPRGLLAANYANVVLLAAL